MVGLPHGLIRSDFHIFCSHVTRYTPLIPRYPLTLVPARTPRLRRFVYTVCRSLRSFSYLHATLRTTHARFYACHLYLPTLTPPVTLRYPHRWCPHSCICGPFTHAVRFLFLGCSVVISDSFDSLRLRSSTFVWVDFAVR